MLNKDKEYKYIGVELTPCVFQELLIELFDGKRFSRRSAIDAITTYHVKEGGTLRKKSYIGTFKKATQRLQESGIKNIGYGMWQLTYTKKTIEDINQDIDCPSCSRKIELSSDKEIGTGKNSVYIYYYETYKKIAELQNKNIWECKIGRSDTNPISRIIEQASTGYPEFPHIAMIIHCDDSSTLEKAFHNVLKIKNRWLSNAPGTEWYLTSPEELEKIYYMMK